MSYFLLLLYLFAWEIVIIQQLEFDWIRLRFPLLFTTRTCLGGNVGKNFGKWGCLHVCMFECLTTTRTKPSRFLGGEPSTKWPDSGFETEHETKRTHYSNHIRVFPKMVVPPNIPKWSFLSRKTNSCWVPLTTVLGNPHIIKSDK